MIDLLEIPGFLDAEALEEVRAEMRRAGGAAATVTGESEGEGEAVRFRVRRSTRLAVGDAARERVKALLLARVGELEARFGTALGGCEEPQFLRYTEGDYFVAHQDGNTPLIHDDTRHRRVSAVVFLSEPSEAPAPGAYGGGALVFHGRWPQPALRVPVAPPPGTLVAFRAETTHEVTPVTHGERLTVAAFFRAPPEAP